MAPGIRESKLPDHPPELKVKLYPPVNPCLEPELELALNFPADFPRISPCQPPHLSGIYCHGKFARVPRN